MTMTKLGMVALAFAPVLVASPTAAEEAEPVVESPPPSPAGRPADEEPIEHSIVVGIGAAAEFELGDRLLHPGASAMVEWDAVEDWLELEIGASVLSTSDGIELPVDLLIKKPFRLTPRSEVMIGIGPQVVHISGGPDKGTHLGGELALDFMFWPWGRRVGLWIAPEYDLVFHNGVSSGIGATGGILLGF